MIWKGVMPVKRFMCYDFTVERLAICCHVPPGAGAPVHRNRAAHGVVFYTKGGEKYRFAGGTELTVREGELLYLPKGSSYTVLDCGADGESECYAINFDISEQVAFPPFVTKVRGRAGMQELFRRAAFLWRERRAGYVMRCMAQLYHVFAQLQEEYRIAYVTQGKAERIAPALARIHATYTEDTPTIPALAALCGMSPEYFRAIFRQCLGESPLRYVNTLRLTHARELIESGVCSVTEAAARAGFQDACYFSREFKKRFGTPPAAHKR